MHTTPMRSCARILAPAIALSACLLSTFAQTPPAAPNMDPTIAAIRNEGLNHSQVMETLDYLCNIIGPRLTGSPNAKRANEWTMQKMTQWGLTNAHLEAWGPFGRGWALKRFSAEVIEPQGIPLRAYPKA